MKEPSKIIGICSECDKPIRARELYHQIDSPIEKTARFYHFECFNDFLKKLKENLKK